MVRFLCTRYYFDSRSSSVIPGQIMRKQIPPERTRDVLDFATMAPEDRLRSIKNGFSVGTAYIKLIHQLRAAI